jgi:hypothetical protein
MATQTSLAAEDWKRVRESLARSLDRLGTTPGVLRAALGTVWVVTLLFFLVLLAGDRQYGRALQTVAQDATASITASQKIKAYLADMDSNAANELLGNPDAVKDYEKRRLQVDHDLVEAAKNITYPAERELVEQLVNQLGQYEAAIARAQLLRRREDKPGALQAYRQAEEILHRQPDPELVKDKDRILDPDRPRDRETIGRLGLLAAAEQLDRVNRQHLDRAYAAGGQTCTWVVVGTVLLGLALLAALAAVQVFLYRRMHRVFNPALLGATAVAVGLLGYGLGSFRSASYSLKTAKQDAFDSIHALWRARADAYDANGDESRWLYDRERADAYEKSFHEGAARLVTLPPGMTYAQLVSAVRGDRPPDKFQGYFAAELRNITFPGEREAATDALVKFVQYVAVDDQIRELERKGDHAAAVKLCIGTKPGESNYVFDQLDQALAKTIDINDRAFTEATDRGKGALAPFSPVAAVLSLAVAGLALVGLRPRLREYAA